MRNSIILGLGLLSLMSLMIMGVQAACAVDNLFEDGSFESGRLRQTIHWRSDRDVELVKDAFAGNHALRLPGGEQRNASTVRIPVQAGRRYSFRFYAKVDGPGAIALDMQADPDHAVERLRRTTHVPSWRLRLHDEQAKAVARGHPQFYNRIIHDDWTQYREDFYVPPGTVELSAVFSNGTRNTVTIDAIELVELAGQPLNVNPQFALGPVNFSGYNYAHQVRICPHEDEQAYYLNAREGWVVGDPIPVTQQRYALRFRARRGPTSRRAGVRLRYMDANQQTLRDSIVTGITRTDWDQAEYDFVPPAGVAFIRFIIGGGDFDWIRLEGPSVSRPDG